MLENTYEHTNFFENALALSGSVTPKVINKVLLVVAYACIISLLNYFYPKLVLPIGPFEYGGLIMGLVLVFRLNTGYDRWWEARKLWGNIVNHCRNLSTILAHYTTPNQTDWAAKVCQYVTAFPWLLKDYLRNTYDPEQLKKHLDETHTLDIHHAKNPLLTVSSLLAKELGLARKSNLLDSFAFLRAEETRAQLMDAVGGCERILRTPIPFVMAVKSRRFILFFLLMLPLSLIHVSNAFISPVISGLVAYALFALDQIGLELQNPFSDSNLSHLPLNTICDNITNDIATILEQSNSLLPEVRGNDVKTVPLNNRH